MRVPLKAKRNGKRGFTLVEMLMVIVVMIILAVVISLIATGMMRTFTKVREEAELMRQVTLAFEIVRRDLVGSAYRDPLTLNVIQVDDSGGTAQNLNFIGLDAVDGGGNANDQVRFYSFLSPMAGASDLTAINYRRQVVGGITRFERAARGTTNAGGLPVLNLAGVETFEPLIGDRIFNVVSLNAQYLENAGGAYQAAYDASTEGNLPRAVRIVVVVQNPRGDQRQFTQTVTLPMP